MQETLGLRLQPNVVRSGALCALFVAAMSSAANEVATQELRTRTLSYDCAGENLDVIVLLDNATVLARDRAATLRRSAGSSGERFVDAHSELRLEAETAEARLGDLHLTRCRIDRHRALLLTGELRGAHWVGWQSGYRNVALLYLAPETARIEVIAGTRRSTYVPLKRCGALETPTDRGHAYCWMAGPNDQLRWRRSPGREGAELEWRDPQGRYRTITRYGRFNAAAPQMQTAR